MKPPLPFAKVVGGLEILLEGFTDSVGLGVWLSTVGCIEGNSVGSSVIFKVGDKEGEVDGTLDSILNEVVIFCIDSSQALVILD